MTLLTLVKYVMKGEFAEAGEWIKTVLGDKADDIVEKVTNFKDVISEALTKTIPEQLTKLIPDALAKLIGYLTPTALAKAVFALLDAMAGVCEFAGGVIGKIAGAVKTAASDPSGAAAAVKSAVIGSFSSSIVGVMKFLVQQILGGSLVKKLKDMRKSVSESIAKAVSGTIKKVTAPVTKLLKKLTGRTPLTTPQPGKAKSNGKPVDVQVYTDQNGKVWIEWNPRISEDELAEIAKKQKSCKPTKVNPDKITAVKNDKKEENDAAYKALTEEEAALGKSLGGCDLPAACKTDKSAGAAESGVLAHNASSPCADGVGYTNADWASYATLNMRPQNHPNAPLSHYPVTRSVNVLLDKSTLSSRRSDVSKEIKKQLFQQLSYFFDSSGNVLPNSSSPQQARIGYTTDTGGHIIPSQFGGPGTDRKNVFAQSPTSQREYDDVWGHSGRMTQSNGQPTIYARVQSGCDVCVRIILTYEKGVSQFPFTETGKRPYRPTGIHVRIWDGGSSVPGRRFSN
jgi:hypothetical protein